MKTLMPFRFGCTRYGFVRVHTGHAGSSRTGSEHAASDRAASGHAASDRAASGHAASGRAASGHAIPVRAGFTAALAALAAVVLILFAPMVSAADAPGMHGVWLTTDYPTRTARPGDTANLKLKLQNYNSAPEVLELRVGGLPAGWKAVILGAGSPVASAMPGINENVALQLRVDVPNDAKAGSYRLLLSAGGNSQRADLPVAIVIGQELPAKLQLRAKLPSLRGTPKSSFEYQFTAQNESDKDLIVRFGADAPPGFQATFSEGYGSQEISSIPIEAGQSKDMKAKIQPPENTPANDYPVRINANAEGTEAGAEVTLQVTGQPTLRLSGPEGRLSGEAQAGSETQFLLTLANEGSAPASNVELTANAPAQWKVEFNPKLMPQIAPGQKIEISALVTPSSKAVSGDYMATLRASGNGASTSAEFRVTVTTSTLWGILGILIIAIALMVAVGAVSRFGRR